MNRVESKYQKAAKIKKRQQAEFRRFIRGEGTPVKVREYIGLNWQETRLLLENRMLPSMSWNNYGTHWVIDHVVPFWIFNLEDPAELKLLWHPDNLMPMIWKDNNLKQGDLHFSIRLLTRKKGYSITIERLMEKAQKVLEGQDKYMAFV